MAAPIAEPLPTPPLDAAAPPPNPRSEPPPAPPPPDVPSGTEAPSLVGLDEKKPARFAAFGATDIGRRRETNQDAFLVDSDLALFIVADGMGGHAGGGTASRLAVETIHDEMARARTNRPDAFQESSALESSPLPDLLGQAVEAGCARIYRRSREDPSLAGMGTTATLLLLNGLNAFVAHVGDSRLYLVRGGDIWQITEDHSLVNEQIKAGVLTPEEARRSQLKNVITRSVGFEEDVLVDLLGLSVRGDDTFIVCCDGLSNMVEDAEIAAAVQREPLADLPARLIALANDRGGDDNITVVAVRILAP